MCWASDPFSLQERRALQGNRTDMTYYGCPTVLSGETKEKYDFMGGTSYAGSTFLPITTRDWYCAR